MSTPHIPTQNRLLAVLPAAEARTPVSPSGAGPDAARVRSCTSPAAGRSHVYFPTTSIVSLLYVLADGASAEIAVVGNEGVVGVALFMGGETTPSRADRAERGLTPIGCTGPLDEGGIQSRRGDAASVAALHPGAAHPDGADGGVQSASFGGTATVSLAAAEPRSIVLERADHDAGIDCQHARGASRRGDGGRRATCRAPA